MGLYIKLYIKEPPKNVKVAPVIEEKSVRVSNFDNFVIGRSSKCDLTLDGEYFSSRHCSLHFDGQYLVIKDLTSKNGTYVNGNSVFQSFLKLGDIVQLGYCHFHIDEQLTSAEYKNVLKNQHGKDRKEISVVIKSKKISDNK